MGHGLPFSGLSTARDVIASASKITQRRSRGPSRRSGDTDEFGRAVPEAEKVNAQSNASSSDDEMIELSQDGRGLSEYESASEETSPPPKRRKKKKKRSRRREHSRSPS